EGDFTLADGKKVKMPLMHQTHPFRMGEGDGVRLLELPYKGKQLSMVLLLPEKSDGLADLERKLTGENLTRWLDGLRTREVMVTLPKFKMTSEFALKPTLSALGMPTAFSSRADFSGLNGKTDLFIQQVVHKAFVD